jgi:hypothetical protein
VLLIDLPLGLVMAGILFAVALALGIGFLAAGISTLRNDLARARRYARGRAAYRRRYGLVH